MKPPNHADSIIEARMILELAAIKMAAGRRTYEDLREIKTAQNAFCDHTLDYGHAIEEDLILHLKIVSAGKNNVLKSLFMKIIPDLLVLFNKTKEQDSPKFFKAIHEHDSIIEHLTNKNEAAAVEAMELHLGARQA